MRSFTLDAKKTIKGKFKPSPTAEREFMRALKRVAQVSGHIVHAHQDGAGIKDDAKLQKSLKDYARLIEPWAKRQSQKLLQQVQKSNRKAYQQKSKAIGAALQLHVAEREVGDVAARLMVEQVALIQSIPLEAGLRAQKIALEAVIKGQRASADPAIVARLLKERRIDIETHNQFAELAGTKELQEEMDRSTEVAISRAVLIARTETARATASINQARAMKVGSSQYRWHNSGDESVRHSHKYLKGKPLQGRIFSWDDPPTLDDGTKGHPGTFPNCRCFAEPVFDEE